MGETPLPKSLAKISRNLDLRSGWASRQAPEVLPSPDPRRHCVDPAPKRGDRRIEIGREVGRHEMGSLIDLAHADGKKPLVLFCEQIFARDLCPDR